MTPSPRSARTSHSSRSHSPSTTSSRCFSMARRQPLCRSGSRHREMPPAWCRAVQREQPSADARAAKPCGGHPVSALSMRRCRLQSLHAKAAGAMRVFKNRRAHAIIADDGRNRARVTSSRDGSGVCGANRPSCTLLDRPASAVSSRETTAACGGCAAISSCRSLSRNLRSVEGTAGRSTHWCVSASFQPHAAR